MIEISWVCRGDSGRIDLDDTRWNRPIGRTRRNSPLRNEHSFRFWFDTKGQDLLQTIENDKI